MSKTNFQGNFGTKQKWRDKLRTFSEVTEKWKFYQTFILVYVITPESFEEIDQVKQTTKKRYFDKKWLFLKKE